MTDLQSVALATWPRRHIYLFGKVWQLRESVKTTNPFGSGESRGLGNGRAAVGSKISSRRC